MTQIIPGESKGPVFKKDQVITVGDLCRLQQMGRHHLYVTEENQVGPEWVHENEAALAFAQAMAGEGVVFATPPREGKVNLLADRQGLFAVEEDRLQAFNLLPGVMCACRHSHTVVSEGRVLAGTRAIPLYLPRGDFHKAMAILGEGPLFRVLPLKPARVGVLVTGTEVFLGLVEDRFIPIIQNKVEKYGCEVVHSLIVPDDRRAISTGIRELLDAGADLLVTTAGLSVDPDDVTRQGLLDAGAADLLYGAPILPGAMTLLARIGPVRVIGVPACALYFKRTSFDLILPRLLAGLEVNRRDLAQLGHGALCLDCQTCSFPKCPFGR
jgi:formylmethanofuran dehydrogenase subunit E